MDIVDFFENMGLGVGIVIVFAVFLFLMVVASAVIPALLRSFGLIILILIIMIVIGAVIYFIGKFAKGFIKK